MVVDWCCFWQAQIQSHLVTYEVVASLLSMPFVWSVTMCFYTITTKYNGPLNTFSCHSHNVRHELVFWRGTDWKPKLDGLFFLLWVWRLFTSVEYADLLPIWSDYSISILYAFSVRSECAENNPTLQLYVQIDFTHWDMHHRFAIIDRIQAAYSAASPFCYLSMAMLSSSWGRISRNVDSIYHKLWKPVILVV